jgi:hypothetical protein
MKNIFKMSNKQHIEDANAIADSIFSRPPEQHMEMFLAIADRLSQQYEAGQTNFNSLGNPVIPIIDVKEGMLSRLFKSGG